MRFVPLLGLLFAASALAQSPALDPSKCVHDDDCVVTDFASCCSPCRDDPHAASKNALDAQQQVCAVVDCVGKATTCPKVKSVSEFRAACVSNACVLQPARSECSADSDCTLVEQEACCPGCPISPPRALAPHERKQLEQRCAKQGKCHSEAQDCAPRVAPFESFRAACEAGKCVTKKKR